MTPSHKFPMPTVSFDLTSSAERQDEQQQRSGQNLHYVLNVPANVTCQAWLDVFVPIADVLIK
jgi:hypothetical protein